VKKIAMARAGFLVSEEYQAIAKLIFGSPAQMLILKYF
jgi:hypothetical protein